MSADHTYNGWANYETWCVNLWLSNEEPSYRYWRERARRIYDDAVPRHPFTREEAAGLDLADEMKETFVEGMPEIKPSAYSDLLSAALSEVVWYEIAKHWIDDAVECIKLGW